MGKGIRTGIMLWTTRGELPHRRGRKRIEATLTAFRAGIVDELGGESKITSAQEVLIEASIRGYGVILLADLHIPKCGPFHPGKAAEGVLELQPYLGKSFLAYVNNIRLNLAALFPGGLSQRTEDGLTLAKVIQEATEAKEKAEEGSDGQD